jgi:coenzyme F420-dependent glucose-6-phosphate dehydrogenase
VSYRGRYYETERARLYTPPAGKIPLYMAATGSRSTRVAAKYCDGLITLVDEGFQERISDFKKAAGEDGRDAGPLEIITEYKVSCDEDYERALASTRRWKPTSLKGVLMAEIHDPRELEEKAAREVSDEALKKSWDVMTSIDDITGALEGLFLAGATRVYVHSSSPDEMKFIREFTGKVLPHFSGP